MLRDFGAESYFGNSTLMLKYIDDIISNFSVILIQEQFEESLVVLKNKLCWDWSDIMYVSANRGSYKFDVINTTLFQIRRNLHQKFSPYDYVLYEKSLNKLQNDISKISNFEEQLKDFRTLKEEILLWCSKNAYRSKMGKIGFESKFSKSGFTNFTSTNCQLMNLEIHAFMKKLLKLQQK